MASFSESIVRSKRLIPVIRFAPVSPEVVQFFLLWISKKAIHRVMNRLFFSIILFIASMHFVRLQPVHNSGFDKIQPIRKRNPHEEAHRELRAVMSVEMDFRKQIAQGNTQKRAGCQDQHITDHLFLPMPQKPNPPKSQQSHHRAEHGESDINCHTSTDAMASGLQQTDNGKRVEWLVQKNRKKHPQSR